MSQNSRRGASSRGDPGLEPGVSSKAAAQRGPSSRGLGAPESVKQSGTESALPNTVSSLPRTTVKVAKDGAPKQPRLELSASSTSPRENIYVVHKETDSSQQYMRLSCLKAMAVPRCHLPRFQHDYIHSDILVTVCQTTLRNNYLGQGFSDGIQA